MKTHNEFIEEVKKASREPTLREKTEFAFSENNDSHKSQEHSRNTMSKSCVMGNPNLCERAGKGDITSSGVEDHLPRDSPCDAISEESEVEE